MSADPLSDILRLTEAKSIVSGRASAGGIWSLHFPVPGQVVFAAIVSGACWVRLDGKKKAIRLEQGDVGLLSGRHGFLLGSTLSGRPTEVSFTNEWGAAKTIGDGSGCTWLVGRVLLHPASASLLTQALPDLVHVRTESPSAASLRWILQELVEEQRSRLPGASVASGQLAQLFFVRILRAHLASGGALPRGWLRAVSDERIGHAVRLMHDHPERGASLAALAKSAGMSRTRFAVHFKSLAGVPPLTYLTQWRMRLAQRQLGEADIPIAALAETLGYASESAFSHAFKRVIGASPRAYRTAARDERTPTGAAGRFAEAP